MIKITEVKNPIFLFSDNNKILCQIKTDAHDGWQDFLATDDDFETYGRELHAELLAGKYGVVEEYVAPTITSEQNKATASQLLADSDWAENPSVSDTSVTPHLTNIADIIAWRVAVRAIAVNPTAGDIEWPVKPKIVWSK